MASPESSNAARPEREYSGWVALFAGLGGVIIGLFLGHWAACGVGLGCAGWMIGALVDRSRR